MVPLITTVMQTGGCVLLNVVDLADVGYTESSVEDMAFTLSGYLGPNDGKGAFVEVDETKTYEIGTDTTPPLMVRSSVHKLTLKKLKGTYYVRVRAYTNVRVGGKTKKLYSSWVVKKKIKIRK